jgi:hypothetical protein
LKNILKFNFQNIFIFVKFPEANDSRAVVRTYPSV